jgi:signal transduction histidine kinase
MLARKSPQNTAKRATRVATERRAWALVVILGFGLALHGCQSQKNTNVPSIVFTKIPPAAEGGAEKFAAIAGRVSGARAGQRVVVYARSGVWWVQPFTEQPFTPIQANSEWSTLTHLGDKYAALLVEPTFRPPLRIEVLPTQGDSVVAVTTTKGVPPFWQTWWFLSLSIALVLFLVWWVHLYRLNQLAKQFNIRLEERVGERSRIARELHDTLLQSFHGVLLRFQAASNALPTHPEEAKQKLDCAIDQAAHAIAEGRNAVQGLRSTVVTDDLATALSTLGEELAADKSIQISPVFEVDVEGIPRELHPLLRDEVYRIAGEALRNAFRHAQAQRIELEIRYAQKQLRLRIRDDGKGMESEALNNEGRPGHWGLPGMRERTRLVGGNLEVWSKLQQGTEIELTIPASAAYASAGGRRS